MAKPSGKGKQKQLLSRKKRRKQERAAKKAKTAAYFSRKKQERGNPEGQFQHAEKWTSRMNKGEGVELVDKQSLSRRTVNLPKTRPNREPKSSGGHKAALSVASRREDHEIGRLEKLLKLKRRKNKQLPASFQEDGLTYLLDLTDRDSSEWNLSGDELEWSEEGSGSEPEETNTRVPKSHKAGQKRTLETPEISSGRKRAKLDSSMDTVALDKPGGVTNVPPDRPVKSKKKARGLELEEGSRLKKGILKQSPGRRAVRVPTESPSKRVRFSLGGIVDPESDSAGEGGGVEINFNADLNESGSDGTESSESDEEEVEDVEWREEEERRYVPPHLREEKATRNLERLRKRIQGLINRLSESNMQNISTQLEQLYFENSRNDMNSSLTDVLIKSCVTPSLLSDRLAMEHAMLVAILHSHIGTEVGAYVVQVLAERLDQLLSDPPNYGRGKECDCVILLLTQLYNYKSPMFLGNYKVIHCVLIYDIIRRLLESFRERDVELLFLLLKNAGMEIRKDDATSLKDIILQIQAKAAASSLKESSRMRFMLDTITALRTNNARKIPNYDPSLLEHMKKHLRGLVRSSGPADEGQLKISLQDLLCADKQGRWWIVGSAWSGRDTNTAAGTPDTAAGKDVALGNSWVLELARKQRMSTDVRKNIFSVLMTSEDYVDAFEKLSRLGLKDVQEREIIHVLVDCCLQGKTYNPYYAFLGQKLCEFKRSHQVTFQYALWDRFKALGSLTPANRTNLRNMSSHLIASRALSVAILRVVEFTELGRAEVKFYKQLLQSLLCDRSEECCRSVFARLSPLPHLKPLRDELLVFMKHFLFTKAPSDNQRDKEKRTSVLINERIGIAEQALRTEGLMF